MPAQQNQSSKGSKMGRNSGRPSQKVYVATKRSEVNKRKRIARHQKRMAAKAAHRTEWQAANSVRIQSQRQTKRGLRLARRDARIEALQKARDVRDARRISMP